MSAMLPPPAPPKPIVIRTVWSDNVDDEFVVIRSLIDQYSYVSIDTEFPGTVVEPPEPILEPPFPAKRKRRLNLYFTIKSNVNILNLIQVGLTCSDADGNLPDLGTKNQYIWEFNLKDFDEFRDPHAKDSINLLKHHGIDFDRNRKDGIETSRFAELMMSSGLVCNDMVTWVTFHGASDFAYLIKILTGRKELPDDFNLFQELLKLLFGNEIYDVKNMIRFIDGHRPHGGLDRVAGELGLQREIGESHQSGSDSLLTWRVFQKIKNRCKGGHEKYAGVVHGL